MFDNPYVQLAFVSLLPVAAACMFYFLNAKTHFKMLPEIVKQIIYGLVFGGLAVLGTEFGIPFNGAQVNCRDGAVITAGLFFGAPAGLIAGFIGGIERWIAVAWGVGTFTRLACTLATVFAGIFSALLRKFIFDNKRPTWGLSLATGVVVEVFHMTMVLVTNMAEPGKAFQVVYDCSAILIGANALSVTLSAIVLTLLSKTELINIKKKKYINQTVQSWLLVAVVCAFAVTTLFLFNLQHTISKSSADSSLGTALKEVSCDLSDNLDSKLEEISERVSKKAYSEPLDNLLSEFNVSEINVIDKNGIITETTCPEFQDFDMHSSDQSSEFLCLLNGKKSYIQEYSRIGFDNTRYRKYVGIATDDGFVQVGYYSKELQKNINSSIKDITNNRYIGVNGFLLITDSGNEVISAPKWRTLGFLNPELLKKIAIDSGESSEIETEDGLYTVRAETIEAYRIYAFMPTSEVYATRNAVLYVNTFLEVLVFGVLFILVSIINKRIIVTPIQKINVSLGEITGGNLEEKVDVRSNVEFDILSDDINSTVDTLNRYIEEASARIDSELAFAKNIQYSALPKVTPVIAERKEFDIAASMFTAKEVGGDFYDFYVTNSNTVNFLVADVSGKGIPAAMFMMRAKTELRSLTESNMALADVFTTSNKALCEGNDADMFVTAWQCSLNLESGAASFVNAGHNPPLIKKADGRFEYLKSRAGFVLAGLDSVKYKSNELSLGAGDVVFLYTDGVTEATDSENRLYGEDRLLAKLNERDYATMDELLAAVKADVDAFVGDAPQFDDITMVALRYNGTPETAQISFDRASIEDIPAVTDFVEAELEKMDCPMKAKTQIDIAIDELYSNIAKFAYDNGDGPVTVKVKKAEDSNSVIITFVDNGRPYNPMTAKDPDVSLSAEERKIGGLGIFMVKKTMDDMQYRYVNDQNVLIIRKNLD